MSDYTVDMFSQDYDEMIPVLKSLKHVKLPDEEWPIVNLALDEIQKAIGMTSDRLQRIVDQLEKKGLLKEPGDIGGIGYRLNPNDPSADTVGFFRSKYGQSKGRDYAIRFLSTIWFINDNRDALIEEGLIRKESGQTMVEEELIRVILDSFSSPEPPALFPTSTFEENDHILGFRKVLEAVKPLLQE